MEYFLTLKSQLLTLANNPGAVAILLGVLLPVGIGIAFTIAPSPPRIAPDDPAVTGIQPNNSTRDATRSQADQTRTSIMPPPRADLAEPKDDLYTLESLAKYDGTDPNLPIYVSIKGTVFDVTNKREVYGPPTGSYRVFAGKDASRAFGLSSLKVEDATADWSTLEPKELKVLDDWYNYFKKRYNIMGSVSDMPESVRKHVWRPEVGGNA